MGSGTAPVIGGLDTHKRVRHAAALAGHGELLGTAEFPTVPDGHKALWAWLGDFGKVESVGIQGTGFFGASLARFLDHQGLEALDVNRPNRSARRADGKSDRLGAEQTARAVLAKTATAIPRDKTGPVEAIRTLRLTRKSAMRAKNRTTNGLHATVICSAGPTSRRAHHPHEAHAREPVPAAPP
jgi:transposase